MTETQIQSRDHLIYALEHDDWVYGVVRDLSSNSRGWITVQGWITGYYSTYRQEYVFEIAAEDNAESWYFDYKQLVEAEIVG